MSRRTEAKILVHGEWVTVSDFAEKIGKPVAGSSRRLLQLLAEKEEPLRLEKLAAELKITKQTIYVLVRLLERKGLIARVGKRNVLVGITEAGYKQAKAD